MASPPPIPPPQAGPSASKTVHFFSGISRVFARQADPTGGAGSARTMQQSSASTVLNTLWPVILYSLLFFILFLFLRRIFPRLYTPRTMENIFPNESQRSEQLRPGFFNSLKDYYNAQNIEVLRRQGTLDGYLFLRLLRLAITSCLVGCVITFPILIPINATGAAHRSEFNLLTFSNVAAPEDPNSYNRYYAHVICAYLFFGYILYAITRESLFYINIRQAYLLSPSYANRLSSRTVLFMAVPNEYLKEDVLRKLLGPELVHQVWIPYNTDDLEEKIEERNDMLMRLEKAEIQLIQDANKARTKAHKRGKFSVSEQRNDIEADESGSVAKQWTQKRPRHWLSLWRMWEKKVDTIDWCRDKLPAKIEEVRELQRKHRCYEVKKPRHCAFVEFNTLKDAQTAYQVLMHHLPLHMSPRLTGVYPEEIIWSNLNIRWWERIVRTTAAYSAIVALIVLWSFPIAFVGSISKVKYLQGLPGLGWLSFINHLGFLTGIVTGLLPVILLSVLMAILPIFLRLMHRLAGDPTQSSIEYSLQSSYFWFYVIQGFIVTTLSSGAIEAAGQIFDNPASVVNILAKSLPEASNFYLSFFILQGFGIVSQVLVSIGGLVFFFLVSRALDTTPRDYFNRWMELSGPSLGTLYPVYTTMFIIAISYSCIAPLVLGFGTIGLALFYLAFKYEFLYVYSIPYDNKGLMYARALQQLFVGLYLAEGCLIGLFAINLEQSSKLLGPLILMIIFLVFTALYHYSLNSALQPNLEYLPKTLENEEERLLAEEEQEQQLDIEDAAPDREGKRGSLDSRTGIASSPTSSGTEKEGVSAARGPNQSKQEKRVNFFQTWLRPDKYENFYALRKLIQGDHKDQREKRDQRDQRAQGRSFYKFKTAEELKREAYFHPSVVREPGVLWIPRDDAGVSKQEVAHTSKVTFITDEEAILNNKCKVEWNPSRVAMAPIWEQVFDY